jgi:cell fate regulator YaaT (PSP1 superfamily)
MIIKVHYHIYNEKFKIATTDNLIVGHHIVFRLDKSTEIGKIMDIYNDSKNEKYKTIETVKIAENNDLQKMYENRAREKDAFVIFKEKIKEHKLPMKAVDTELEFDRKRIKFFFTADNRIDFRNLVKDLAAIFKIRIELRQIGVRDYAKRLGGLGPCGRPFCCITFLKDFEPITLQVAKDQQVNLNPKKLSGACGRLMCCLSYEHKFYKEMNIAFPNIEEIILTEKGKATVLSKEIFNRMITVKDSDGNIYKISLAEYAKLNRRNKWSIFPSRRAE